MLDNSALKCVELAQPDRIDQIIGVSDSMVNTLCDMT